MSDLKLYSSYFLHVLILLTCVHCQAQGDKPVGEESNLESRIDSIFVQFDDLSKPGVAVAVVKNGAIVFKKGYGSANLEYDIPNSPSTIFHIASVSKQFTVFSILLLADQGKLSFDDDIRKYIPEVPDFGKTITIRHLAAHTSGLRDQWNLLSMAGWRLDDVITKEHVLKLVANQKELNFEPGEEYMYCNTGFTLLAEVVSRVSGMSFAEFTKANIFDPLSMSNTLFYDDHEKVVKNRAYSYYSDSTGFKKSVLSYANVGATSLFTTVEDLSLWALNFSVPKVGNADILNQMNTLAVLNNGETFGGAYGQFINTYEGLNRISHGGADAGYRSYLGRFPDNDFTIIIFSNYAAANPGGLAREVVDLYLEDDFAHTAEDPAKESKATKNLSTTELEGFAASYWNEPDMYSRNIYVKDDTLMYFRREGNESPLRPIGNNVFQMLNVTADVTVKFKNTGKMKTMIVTINKDDPIFSESYTPSNYSDEELMQFAGTFYSEELSTAYTFVVEAGNLVAKHPRLSDITLAPIKQDMFSGNQWFFSNIRFVRESEDEITGMRVSSGRVRNLYFEKTTHNENRGH